ncbi:hypothetical protein ACFVY1_38820 [Streptomyces sp. NPDC058293]|uniref:hypothetical protein n=1 Tax=Streptomyces sp. NPDC058293 TaxID=3346429 RepID=UPI0036E0F253
MPGLDRKAQVSSSSRVSGTHRMLHDEGDLDNDDAWVRGYALRGVEITGDEYDIDGIASDEFSRYFWCGRAKNATEAYKYAAEGARRDARADFVGEDDEDGG